MGPLRPHGDSGTGVFATTFGFGVFMLFLFLAIQILFGLHARTTVTAVAADVARRVASGSLPTEVDLRAAEAMGRSRLGGYGRHTDFHVLVVDVDRDGHADTVEVSVRAQLPSLLPLRWVTGGSTRFTRRAHARVEQFQAASP